MGGAVISNDLERCERVTKVGLHFNLNNIYHPSATIAYIPEVGDDQDLLALNVSLAVLQALQSGIVWINCSQPCFCQAPWGGKKRSGFGRELGEW